MIFSTFSLVLRDHALELVQTRSREIVDLGSIIIEIIIRFSNLFS